jgi:hypothetical protein
LLSPEDIDDFFNANFQGDVTGAKTAHLFRKLLAVVMSGAA